MKKHILIVDDDEGILDSLRRALHRCGDQWSLTFASGAESAWQQLLDASYDAVVADVRMPGLGGMELLERMQQTERTRGVPVVMLTGDDDRELKGQALELGAMDLLNKPVDLRELIARLRSVLRLKDNLDGLREANDRLEKKVLRQDLDLAHSRMNVVCRLGMAAEYRDEVTGNHVVRVGCYSRAIAAQLGLSPAYQQMLLLAAPLHDIGKIGIPDSILLKDGPLSDAEWTIMQRHCEIGERIICDRSKTVAPLFVEWRADELAAGDGPDSSDPVLEMAASIALNHHEWWDGSGYPRRLAGAQIPLEARIVAVADVFDALISNRPYRPARSEEETLLIMAGTVGTHFDSQVHRAFTQSLAQIRDIRAKLADEVDVFPVIAEGVAV